MRDGAQKHQVTHAYGSECRQLRTWNFLRDLIHRTARRGKCAFTTAIAMAVSIVFTACRREYPIAAALRHERVPSDITSRIDSRAAAAHPGTGLLMAARSRTIVLCLAMLPAGRLHGCDSTEHAGLHDQRDRQDEPLCHEHRCCNLHHR